MPLVVALMFIAAIICVAGIAGWATVTAARSFGGKGDDEMQLRLEELTAAVAGLQADFDDLAQKQVSDREVLEERIDFAERLLASGRDRPGE